MLKNMDAIVFLFAFIILIFIFLNWVLHNSHRNSGNSSVDYEKPQFKPLTPEEIEDIHLRGKITPVEMVEEWEGLSLCAPGDGMGSASWRCRKFRHNCHDCLVNYANEIGEGVSIEENMKALNHPLIIK